MAEMNKISWSALPQDLLMSIAERLETSVELMSFRAVCPSWRYAVPISLFGSKNILSPVFPYRGMNHSSIVVASSVYLVRSAVNPELPPWLITVEEFSPGKLYVRAPLSRVAIKNLPDGFQHTLDLSDFHLQELGRFYGLRRYDNPEEMFTERRLSRYDNKVVLFVDPDCTESPPTIDDCSVVELYDHVDYLTLTRLKNGEKHQVYSNFRREFDDIVNFKGKIYAVDYQGNVCFLDYHSLKMSSFIEEPLADVSRSNYKKRFAVTCEELYLIFRRSHKSDYHSAFKIFKLNEKKKKWDEIEGGIGDDKIIFVTFDGCFFASVKDFPGWKGNCIVFRRGSFPEYSGLGEFDSKIFEAWGGIGIAIGIGFDWNINLDVAVFHFDSGYCVPIDTYPRHSEVIWPPPAWLRKGERKVPYLSRRFPKNNLFKI